jgi:hypothetical protein
MKLEQLSQRAEELILQADALLATQHPSDFGDWVDGEQLAGFRSASLSFIERVFGREHPYFSEFDRGVVNARPEDARTGRGIMVAVLGELKGGWVITARGLVAAELFADFLDMAGYLLSEGYKDAAAVMTGSVLEEHLRQLAAKNGVSVTSIKSGTPVPRKADAINADLAGKDVYGKLDQKSATAWLDLRNKAAHGKYSEFTIDQVRLMHQGVLDFMSRVAP